MFVTLRREKAALQRKITKIDQSISLLTVEKVKKESSWLFAETELNRFKTKIKHTKVILKNLFYEKSGKNFMEWSTNDCLIWITEILENGLL